MTRPPHKWTSTDIALYSMGKMDMTGTDMQQRLPVGGIGPDAEAVAKTRRTNWTPSVQYWRQKHDNARVEIERLENANAAYRANSRATFDAMCAMRNSINEIIPVPSFESDLLSGPESSVFCAAVAEAVAAGIRRNEAERDELLKAQDSLAGLVAKLTEERDYHQQENLTLSILFDKVTKDRDAVTDRG